MRRFAIGTLEHKKYGVLKICFHGPHKEITLEQDLPEGGLRRCSAGLVPKSLLNALEIIEKARESGKHSNAVGNIKLFDFNRDELRAADEHMARLKAESKHQVTYAGAPTVSVLINMLEDLVSKTPSLAQFPVYFGGCEWYLHVDFECQCVILDEEMLYEDYELDA